MTRWGDLLERKRPTPAPRFYVIRATGDAALGIGTIETPYGSKPVMGGDVLSWSFDDEPVLLEGASVELLGPMTEEEAESTAAGIATARHLQAIAARQQSAEEARARARLILTGPRDDPSREQVEALAEIIFWARGYDGQELP